MLVHIGNVIRKRRKELKLSRKEMAVLLNISDDYYKKIELGLRKPSVKMLAQIAHVLRLSISEMEILVE
jgi:transcriptional regulator with XRE-family HTH domain